MEDTMLRYTVVAILARSMLLLAGCKKGQKPAEKTKEPAAKSEQDKKPAEKPVEPADKPAPSASQEPSPPLKDIIPSPAEVTPATAEEKDGKPEPTPAPTTGVELWTAACDHAVKLAHAETKTMLHLAPKDEMVADCMAEFERIGGELADKAAGCMVAATGFDDLAPCYDTSRWKKDLPPVEGNGPELWNRACDHIVALAMATPELAGAAKSAGPEMKKACVQEFTTAEHEAADQAAACMLSQSKLDGMDGCVLKLRAARDKEVKERPPLNEDPWLEAMTLSDQIDMMIEQNLNEPDKLIESLKEWYAANEKTVFNVCARMVRLPLEDTATDFADRISAFSLHQAPAKIEAVADKIRTGVDDPAHRKELLSLLFRFREVCGKALSTAAE